MEKTEIKKNSWVSWSEDEIKLLKRLFPLGKAREIAEQTGRPLTAVRQKAYNMGIKTRERHLWSANEIKLLKKLKELLTLNVPEFSGDGEVTVLDLVKSGHILFGPVFDHCGRVFGINCVGGIENNSYMARAELDNP